MHDWHPKRSALRALLLSAALCASAAQPAAAQVVTLADLERSAIASRPQLAAAAARARAARFEVESERSAYIPALGLFAESTLAPGQTLVPLRDPDDPNETVRVQGARRLGDGKAWIPNVGAKLELQLRATLYDFGRTSAAVAASRAGAHAADAAEQVAREAIVLAVRAAYLRWLAQAELLALAEQAAAEATARSQRAAGLVAEGARPKSDLPIARTDELLAALELERARGELRAARLEVEQAVAHELPKGAEPDRALLQGPAQRDAGSTSTSTSDTPQLLALSAEQRAVMAQAEQLAHADAPLLSAGLNAGVRSLFQQEKEGPKLLLFPAYGVGLQFAMPLWDGDGAGAAASAARARGAALAAEIDAERARKRDEIARGELAHDNATARLAAADELLQVARVREGEAEQAYALGAIDLGALAEARALVRRAKTEVLHEQLARAEARLLLRSHP